MIMVGARGNAGLRPRPRSGITLTEILISIMILGVGLVSLATLFPIGLLRLRDATRWSRSATLLQTAASDAISRGLFSSQSFAQADYFNYYLNPNNPTFWYITPNSGRYNPLTQDTPYYGGDWFDSQNNVFIGANANPYINYGFGANASVTGLPFAYDPLWRFQTINPGNTYANGFVDANGNPTQPGGYYIGDSGAFEARFGYGLTTVRPDPIGDNNPPSAHGLQRITNFNRPFFVSNGQQLPVMPASAFVPNVFVSQEDVVWQEAKPSGSPYTIGGVNGGTAVTGPSPLVPDLNISGGSPSLDWRYTWMFTGQLTSAGNASCFDGNIVIFENRPFGISTPANMPFPPQGNFASQTYQVDGETVVEAVFGYSGNVVAPGGQAGGPGYGAAADRTVLLRWPTGMPDPVVRPGDWIADVTYERQQAVVQSRFLGFGGNNGPSALANWANNGEMDNLPAQRCFWYQVQKVSTPAPDQTVANHRYMTVYINQDLQARTVLNAGGTPYYLNAALIAPNVVNVIPQTIFVR
jgi:type II secretory pathway pseudopilin PulG